MLYRRKRRGGLPSGFFRISSSRSRALYGMGDGDFIRLRDEHGNEWRGTAERHTDDTIRYRFTNAEGHSISGVSDGGHGVILRDERGTVWRGFID